MSKDVELSNVTMRFGDFTAVDDLSLTVKGGEFFSFLGPSGCGKTTVLRMVSGFIEPTSGTIRIGGADMRGIGPNKRPTALIFQNLALFPMMSVAENIGFGLEMRGLSKIKRRDRVEELLDLIALSGAGDKAVAELSGGQKQRVAIARALAVEPDVMLLDEPLSALDLKLRQHMRAELRAIQRRTGLTFIYITHDQGEALTMSDRIAVMSAGHIEQVGKPSEIYDAPATPFVARFVGEMNAFAGRVEGAANGHATLSTPYGSLVARNPHALAAGSDAVIFLRPERLELSAIASGPNTLKLPVDHVDFEGSFANVFLRSGAGEPISLQLQNDGRLPPLEAGTEITVAFSAEHAVALPAGGRP